jgi:hypothetical protein
MTPKRSGTDIQLLSDRSHGGVGGVTVLILVKWRFLAHGSAL